MIEKLDFSQKKRNLKSNTAHNKDKAYNDMLSSFAYNKFKEFLSSQCSVKGLELIEINPMYTSLIGQVNYGKKLGLSIHQAASYVIANLNKMKKFIAGDNFFYFVVNAALLYKDFIGIPEKPLYSNYNNTHLIKNSMEKDVLSNEYKLEICFQSKVYELPYIVNSNDNSYADINNKYKQTENIINDNLPLCGDNINYLSEWKDISNSYRNLKKDIYKKNLERKQWRLSKSNNVSPDNILNPPNSTDNLF